MSTRTRITIDEKKMDAYFERVMDEVYMMFHYHPLSFPTEPLTPEELSEMNYYQAMATYYYNLGG